ncbi:MAG: hypothetical protein K1X74_15485 [Pirellulales bacterium]|nr:hypothetical protein [Pirellulales bacterium]
MTTRRSLLTAGTTVGFFLGALLACACETPVWRYAMYRWTAEPYTLVVLEDEAAPVGDVPFTALDGGHLNLQVEHRPRTQEGFELPEQFQAPAQELSDRLPAYLLLSPRGDLVERGPFEPAVIDRWQQSPARTEIVELLASGKAGMLLVLTGADAQASEEAVQLAKGALARAAAGLVPQQANLAANVVVESTEPPPEVGLLVVRRDDPAEATLIKNLLTLEADLANYDTPMVFGVYGRGRAMEPYIGAGITADNMDQCIGYMTGACSCEIKEQNPGMDLLIAADWEQIADELSAEHADDDALGPASTPEEDLAAVVAATGGAELDAPDPPASASAPSDAADSAGEPATSEPQPASTATTESSPAAAPEPMPPAPASTTTPLQPSYRSLVRMRLAVLGGAVVVVSALMGLILMRSRG